MQANAAMRFRSRGAMRPSFALISPSKSEGAGKAGCALHPRSRVQIGQKNAHEHTGSAEAIRPSLRDGFTAYFALSPVTGFLATVAARINPAQLDTSVGVSGPHDFAVRVSTFVKARFRVHRIPSQRS